MKKILISSILICLSIVIIATSFGGPVSANNYRELSVREKKTALKNKNNRLNFFNDTVTINIDAAVSADTEIEAVRVDFNYNCPDFNRKGAIYSFEPEGLIFKKPVLLTLPYDEPDEYTNEDRIGIFYYNEAAGGKWEEIPKVSQDTVNNTICVAIRHFSSYTPGLGSYSVNESLSPNSIYFASNSEKVDPNRGTLFLDNVHLDFPGRNNDLVLESQFSSDRYYYNLKAGNTSWDFESDIESRKIYKIAHGWKWKLPGFRYKYTHDLFGNPNGRLFFFYTENDKSYQLPLLYVKNRDINVIYTVDGARIYKTTNAGNDDYDVVIELVEEKIVIKGQVLNAGSASMQFIPVVVYPDNRIFEFFSITGGLNYSGNVQTIRDGACKNPISFTYNNSVYGSINTITDSLGRIFTCNYGINSSLSSIVYNNMAYNTYTYDSGSKRLIGFGKLVNAADGDEVYQTTTYNYSTQSLMKISITYPSGGISEYAFDDCYVSGATTTISPPGDTIYINTFKYRPVVKTQTIRENAGASALKILTYDYLGARTYTAPSGVKYIMGYYSLLKNNNYVETLEEAWRPWLNYRIKYYTQTYDSVGSPLYTIIVNGVTISATPSSLGQSEYCPLRSETWDSLKKTAACYKYDINTNAFQGVEKEITYLKNGSSWHIDRMSVNEFTKVNSYCDYYQTGKSSFYHNPSDDLNPGTKQYSETRTYDEFGRALTEIDPEGNKTENVYLYPGKMTGTGLDGASYTKKTNKMTGVYKTIRYQNPDLEYVVDDVSWFYYDDNSLNLLRIKKRKMTYDTATTEYALTDFGYDPFTNNLTSITDPRGNVLSLEYDDTYDAFISKDIRVISPAITLDNGITATGIVNEFNYDDLGRLKTKHTAYTDAAGNMIPGYTSETSSYKYDYLGRVTEVTTDAALKKYVYDDTANTLTAYSLVESLGGNSYLAVKSFQQYDGLDRKTVEETARLNITLGSGNAITGQAGSVLTSKKAYEYHPVFTDKVKKTTVYEDTTTAAQISETSFDAYARPLEIKANNTVLRQYTYDDTQNQTTEKSYRDATNFTMKGIQTDWNGNTRWEYDWPATTGTRSTDDAQAKECRYDAFGNKIWVKIPPYIRAGSGNGEEYNYSYNSFGQVEKSEFYKGTTATLTEESKYDNNGNLTEFKDRSGNKTICEYNSLNQMTVKWTYKLINSVLTIEETTAIQYSQFGTPMRIIKKDASGQRQSAYCYTYNNLGQLTEFEQFVGSETDYKYYSITNTYDLAGNIDTTKLWNGEPGVTLIKALDYDMASAGNECAVYELTETGKGGLIAKVRNTMWGGIESIGYSAGPVMKTNYSYNNLLQPISIMNSGKMELSYDYDFQGNITRWTNETIKYFTYDGLNQLLTETEGITTDKYSYDTIGNRTAIDKGNNGSADTVYLYDSIKTMQLNNYTEDGHTWTFSYDPNGNMTGKSDGTINRVYRYNVSNQLIEVQKDGTTICRYEYDSNGLRIRKIANGSTTYYIYNGQSILFEETINSADIIEKREYNIELYGMNLVKFVWDIGNGQLLKYHLLDHLGSRQVACDVNGEIINNNEYGTFGKLESGSTEEAAFTGKKIESDIGLYYFNARWYDPVIGRFTTLDPAQQGVNWYVYCGNNPLKYIDPTGLEFWAELGFTIIYPQVALRIGSVNHGETNISTNAVRFSTGLGLKENAAHEGSQVNAVRHTLWSATITAEFGKNVAIKATNAHEDNANILSQNPTFQFKTSASADSAVDLLNNAIGRDIALKSFLSDMKSLTNEILNAFLTDGLWVSEMDTNGNYTIKQEKLDLVSYTMAQNELSKMDQNGF